MGLSLGLVFHTAEAESISLSSNNDIYYTGDHIVIFGSIDTVFEDMPVTIQVYHESVLVDVDQVSVAKDGTFATSFTADGYQWKEDGVYSVRAFYTTTIIAEITFEFFTEMVAKSSAEFPVDIPNSGTFDVGYTIRGGEVQDMEINLDRYSLLVKTTMNSNGNLVLKLPRESFDAQRDNTDETFIILIGKDGNELENFVHVAYEEIATGDDYRTIRIPLEDGDEWVEVIGTYVIPEFGSIVIVILTVAVLSSIIISKSRLSIRYN
jgi:predicted secreted protein with PEFG-CTERM motif